MNKDVFADRKPAALVILPAFLTLAIVLHHPVLHQADTRSAEALHAGISRVATANAAFHGVILILMSVQASGLFSFAQRLGLSSLWVRTGAMLYGIATLMMFVPGTFDGFVTPLLGSRCTVDPAFCANGLAASLTIEWAIIQAFTKVALAVQALALICWSVALTRVPGWLRWSGIAGTLVASAPLILMGTMTGPINPARLAEIMSFEALWSLGAGIMMWHGRLTVTCTDLSK